MAEAWAWVVDKFNIAVTWVTDHPLYATIIIAALIALVLF